MLTAGAVTSIITYIRNFELIEMLWVLLGVLILFYIFGLGIKKVLDVFDEQIKEAEEKENPAENKLSYALIGFIERKPDVIALSSREDTHKRLTGFLQPANI